MLQDKDSPLSPVLAFNEKEVQEVQRMLETLVRVLRIVPGGGKMEEGYWSYIYHQVRHAPIRSWSNRTMRDFLYGGLGVEMKLLKRLSPLSDQGHRIMHPSATRTITFDPLLSAEECKVQILRQFGKQIAEFRNRVAQTSTDGQVDIRWGVLLWREALDEFLYFEDVMEEPNPDDFVAEFVAGTYQGKPTSNLHIFEKDSHIKRYSVTLPQNGAKVQPYFDVPYVGQGAYAFKIAQEDLAPVWLKRETFNALQDALKRQDQDIDALIISALRTLEKG